MRRKCQDAPTEEQLSQLEKLCSEGGLYLLKIWSASSSSSVVHRAVADACGIIDSGLKDVFTVHLDWRSQVKD